MVFLRKTSYMACVRNNRNLALVGLFDVVVRESKVQEVLHEIR
jgi:hypothetical protein